MLTSLVEEGLGFALLPPSSVHGEVADGPAGDGRVSKPMTRELIFASPIDRPVSTASVAVTALLREEVPPAARKACGTSS